MIPGSRRSAGEEIGYTLQYSWASLVAQLVKNLPAMWETLGSIPGLGRSPGEGKGYPLQYSGMENSMDFIVHGVAKSWTRLSDFHFQEILNSDPQCYNLNSSAFSLFCTEMKKHHAPLNDSVCLKIILQIVLFRSPG